MSQFIRSSINIISSTSKPHSKDGTYSKHNVVKQTQTSQGESTDELVIEQPTSNTDEEDEDSHSKLQPVATNYIHKPISANLSPTIFQNYPVVPNNTRSLLDFDEATKSYTFKGRLSTDGINTTLFHLANDANCPPESLSIRDGSTYELETELANDTYNGTKNTSLQPLIGSSHQTYLFTSSPPLANQETHHENDVEVTMFWKWPLIKNGIDFINRFRKKEPEHDLERQPLLPPTNNNPTRNGNGNSNDCHSQTPLLSPPAQNDNNENSSRRDPLTEYMTANSWLFYIILAIVTVILFLYVLLTGDYTALLKIMRALTCYSIGSSLASTLFGDDFCPSFPSVEL